MKNLKFIFCVFLYVFFSTTLAIGQGGLNFERGTTVFVEDSVFQFKIEIPYGVLNRLKVDFESQNTNTNLSVAGFSFLPLMEVSNTTTNPDSIFFFTKGYRAVLTLWESMQNANGTPQPNKVSFYTYTTIPEAVATYINTTSNHDFIDFFVDTMPYANGVVVDTAKFALSDSIVYDTREFDLVFLDIDEFDMLATDVKYYEDFSRNQHGITLERSFRTLNVKNEYSTSSPTYSMVSFRTLIFRPLPTPELLKDYDSETAIAYKTGNECPPWWRERSIEEKLSEIIREYRAKDTGSEDDYPWNEDWFQWLISIFGLLGAIFIVTMIRRNKEEDNSTDGMSKE